MPSAWAYSISIFADYSKLGWGRLQNIAAVIEARYAGCWVISPKDDMCATPFNACDVLKDLNGPTPRAVRDCQVLRSRSVIWIDGKSVGKVRLAML
jgi:hypothetical protein